MSVGVQTVESEVNGFQKYLIPSDSCYVRFAMQKAGGYGASTNIFYAHVVSVAFAIGAVVMSAFNAVSYALLVPAKALVNLVSYNPKKLVEDIFLDVANLARSVLFVSLGVFFIVAGFLLPGLIFTFFAPEHWKPIQVRVTDEATYYKKQYQETKKELEKRTDDLGATITAMQNQAKQIADLKHGRSWLRWV